MMAVGRRRRRRRIGAASGSTLVSAAMRAGGGGVNRRRSMATSRAFAPVSVVSMRFCGNRSLGRRRFFGRLLRFRRALEHSEETSAGADLTLYCVHSQKTTQKNITIYVGELD
ncbi:uncharacterized protein LOC144588824 [Pogona vitticeps]